ncbi:MULTISPECIES: hypothetical protein [unclassified Aureimonas]|uniref:hypothetical protein n=1 Tax=unclassified Aureimonas TaxID=2615206 RepID=UPI0006F5808D|nr:MULTISPECIES: hypothetical protein [unclassified Aureimonas]KQT52245.1 hypothetical protein ASG62_16445 [Aureimonas sp. Leaf427]KQT65751.1 hypothetical protein ASG54_22615 [Aureimonas sp. Leaf460]
MSGVREWPDVWEALEATTPSGRKPSAARQIGGPTKREHNEHRDRIMRFLGEVEGDMTVAEVREALEEYP